MTDDNKPSLRAIHKGQIAAVLTFVQRAQSDCDVLMYELSKGDLDPVLDPLRAQLAREKLSTLRNRVSSAIGVIDMIDASLKLKTIFAAR